MPVILARGIIDISLYNVSGYATNNMHTVTIHIGIDLIKSSVLTNKKPTTNFFNALLVNVSVPPWTVTDTSSGEAHEPFVSTLCPE